jgi:hypothetical protein
LAATFSNLCSLPEPRNCKLVYSRIVSELLLVPWTNRL